jgi:cyclic nucleotide-binding domain
MINTASQDMLFRILINNRGYIEPMSKQLLQDVAQFFSPAYIHRDTLIIKAGDTSSSSLLFVIRGSVKLITEKYELITVGPGQWFGGEALIEDMSGYTAIAEEDTVCLSLSVSGMYCVFIECKVLKR